MLRMIPTNILLPDTIKKGFFTGGGGDASWYFPLFPTLEDQLDLPNYCKATIFPHLTKQKTNISLNRSNALHLSLVYFVSSACCRLTFTAMHGSKVSRTCEHHDISPFLLIPDRRRSSFLVTGFQSIKLEYCTFPCLVRPFDPLKKW